VETDVVVGVEVVVVVVDVGPTVATTNSGAVAEPLSRLASFSPGELVVVKARPTTPFPVTKDVTSTCAQEPDWNAPEDADTAPEGCGAVL
jgi:hypothetical protein